MSTLRNITLVSNWMEQFWKVSAEQYFPIWTFISTFLYIFTPNKLMNINSGVYIHIFRDRKSHGPILVTVRWPGLPDNHLLHIFWCNHALMVIALSFLVSILANFIQYWTWQLTASHTFVSIVCAAVTQTKVCQTQYDRRTNIEVWLAHNRLLVHCMLPVTFCEVTYHFFIMHAPKSHKKLWHFITLTSEMLNSKFQILKGAIPWQTDHPGF